MSMAKLGGLQCRIVGGTDGRGGGGGPLVALLHGFGAPGDDLVPLGDYIHAPAGTRFLYPAAPLALNQFFGEARAWWMLDLEQRQRELAAGRARNLSAEVPPGMAEARAMVLAMLDEAARKLAAAPERTVLGGFSQGAMLACDAVLRSDRRFAGLVMLSGTLVAREEWGPLMPRRKGVPVLQSHGQQDPILPMFMAEQLRDLLTQAGLSVDWVSFRGGHEIPEPVLEACGRFLRRVLSV